MASASRTSRRGRRRPELPNSVTAAFCMRVAPVPDYATLTILVSQLRKTMATESETIRQRQRTTVCRNSRAERTGLRFNDTEIDWLYRCGDRASPRRRWRFLASSMFWASPRPLWWVSKPGLAGGRWLDCGRASDGNFVGVQDPHGALCTGALAVTANAMLGLLVCAVTYRQLEARSHVVEHRRGRRLRGIDRRQSLRRPALSCYAGVVNVVTGKRAASAAALRRDATSAW